MVTFSTFGGQARSSRARGDSVTFSIRLQHVIFSSNVDDINPRVVQTAAKLALELHGRELEPGHRLNVYISNPERRKERTDADANAREVYVAGLSKFVTKDDLTKLFRTVCSLVMSMFPSLTDVSMVL